MANADAPSLQLGFIGRVFDVQFTADSTQSGAIGKLTAYEQCPSDANARVKRAEFRFTREGLVVGLPATDDGENTKIGYYRPNNLLFIMHLALSATATPTT